jgi:hypothetical protein
MQFERFYSLNQSIVAWFAHLHLIGFQPTLTNLAKCLCVCVCVDLGTG